MFTKYNFKSYRASLEPAYSSNKPVGLSKTGCALLSTSFYNHESNITPKLSHLKHFEKTFKDCKINFIWYFVAFEYRQGIVENGSPHQIESARMKVKRINGVL